MPSLLRDLAVSGSRKSDGTANASGKVFLYSPGTTTIVPGYMDDSLSQAWTTIGGGIPLDAGGRVKIWINDMVDVVISDSSGTTLDTMLGYNKPRAEQVEVENDGFTGTVTDSAGAVSQGLGGKTNVDTVLTSAATSLGSDFQYKESTGATSRNYIDVIRDFGISAFNFGAVGNGIADDTAALQSTLNRLKARGGGVLLLPPGTFLVGNLSLTNCAGLTIQGAGSAATILKGNTAGNLLTFDTCNSLKIVGMSIQHTSTSTGTAMAVSNSTGVVIDDVIHAGNTNVDYRFPLTLTTCSNVMISNSRLEAEFSNAAARGLLATDTGNITALGTSFQAPAGFPIEFAGNGSSVGLFRCGLGGGKIRIAASFTGAEIIVDGCSGSDGASVATATLPTIRYNGTVLSESSTTSAVGAAQTPDLTHGPIVVLTATAGGAGTVTVNAPAILPVAATGQFWDFRFVSASGGNVTWALVATYKLATAMPVTTAHTIWIRFHWDGTNLREMFRADSAT